MPSKGGSSERYILSLDEGTSSAMVSNGASQRIVGVWEVEGFLSRGWDFVATLPDDRIVIKLPH
mgnify:CR=1 FL=1